MQEPRITQKQYERKLHEIEKCGKNMGPHDYIPVAWYIGKEEKAVTHFMCRVCFVRVSMKTLTSQFGEVKI